MLGVLDDAISVAADAVKSAEAAGNRPEPVTLVKVARARYFDVATALIKTGAFRGQTPESLVKTLETTGTAGHLDIMVKLATTAVFPISADLVGEIGDLVEKPATTRTNSSSRESKTDLWGRCCEEAGLGAHAG